MDDGPRTVPVRSTWQGRGALNMPDVLAWRRAANRDGWRSDGRRTADGPRPQHVARPRCSEYARRVRLATRCEPGRLAVRWTTDRGRSPSAARGKAEVL